MKIPTTQSSDPYYLQRFVDAQEPVYERVREELKSGEKRSHWMWFVFPQLAGLGRSSMAQKYAIASRDEARAYLAHPILGPRLRECTRLVVAVQGGIIEQIFGDVDAQKFRSCMTLFSLVTEDNAEFKQALEKYFGGELDPATQQRLS